VEHPDYSGSRDAHDRDPDDFSYSEEGDRHSDGSVPGAGVPIHTLSESTGTGIESPVPTVHRQGSQQSSSRMYEQLARPHRGAASVTRLDLHEGVEGSYDRHRRGAPPPARSNSLHRTASQTRQAYGARTHGNGHGHHHPPHRQQSQHHTFQVCVSVCSLERRTHFHVRLMMMMIGSDTRACSSNNGQQSLSLRCGADDGEWGTHSGSLCFVTCCLWPLMTGVV
jgi:hypothetical protein